MTRLEDSHEGVVQIYTDFYCPIEEDSSYFDNSFGQWLPRDRETEKFFQAEIVFNILNINTSLDLGDKILLSLEEEDYILNEINEQFLIQNNDKCVISLEGHNRIKEVLKEIKVKLEIERGDLILDVYVPSEKVKGNFERVDRISLTKSVDYEIRVSDDADGSYNDIVEEVVREEIENIISKCEI